MALRLQKPICYHQVARDWFELGPDRQRYPAVILKPVDTCTQEFTFSTIDTAVTWTQRVEIEFLHWNESEASLKKGAETSKRVTKIDK